MNLNKEINTCETIMDLFNATWALVGNFKHVMMYVVEKGDDGNTISEIQRM